MDRSTQFCGLLRGGEVTYIQLSVEQREKLIRTARLAIKRIEDDLQNDAPTVSSLQLITASETLCLLAAYLYEGENKDE